jgi:hypothetical protein
MKLAAVAVLCAAALLGACSSGGGPASSPTGTVRSTTAAPLAGSTATAAPVANGDEAARLMLTAYGDVLGILDRSLARTGSKLLSRAKLVQSRRQDAAAAATALAAMRERRPAAGAPADVSAAYDSFLTLGTLLRDWSRSIARPTTDQAIAAEECNLAWWRSQQRRLNADRVLADGKMSVMASLHDLPFSSQAGLPGDAIWVGRQVSCFNASENYVTPLLVTAAKTRHAPDSAAEALCAQEIAYLGRLAADMRRHPVSGADARRASKALGRLVSIETGVYAALAHSWRAGESSADHATLNAAAGEEKGPNRQLKRSLARLRLEI